MADIALPWIPTARNAEGQPTAFVGSLVNLEFTISQAEPEHEGQWVRWVLTGPLWDGPEFLATNVHYWTAKEMATDLVRQKLTRLANLIK